MNMCDRTFVCLISTLILYFQFIKLCFYYKYMQLCFFIGKNDEISDLFGYVCLISR